MHRNRLSRLARRRQRTPGECEPPPRGRQSLASCQRRRPLRLAGASLGRRGDRLRPRRAAADPPGAVASTLLARGALLARGTTPGTPAWGAPRPPYPLAPGAARHAPTRPLLLL